MGPRRAWTLLALTTGALVCALVVAPAASAASTGRAIAPLAFLGLPSLSSIIKAIANGFFGALASVLVPGFLKHGTVATIQHLVALPDPASWSHVGQLQGEMVYLGAMLLPVSLAVGTVRYWMIGFTGAAHPASAIGRCVGATAVLVAYRPIVDDVVAGTNTLTHAILGFPVVGDGLARVIGVLFGGALLSGAGGVFGAFLVIVGVLFAAGLFALQVLLTVILAALIVAGPPLIALSAIPELSHLGRTWAHALMAVAIVPLGWTVLFATAGALCLDATSFTGGAGGLPGHIAAAFAGLITFVIAVKLPLMLLGEMRHLFGAGSFSRRGGETSSSQATMPGAGRMRAAHARLRSAALQGVPSLGQSAGRAAGALGAPAGGPLGAARRGLAGAARRSPLLSGAAAGAAGAGTAAGAVRTGGSAGRTRRGVRQRLRSAGAIIASAPREARAAMAAGFPKAARVSAATAAAARTPAGSSGVSGAAAPIAASAQARSRPAAARSPVAGPAPSGARPRVQPKPASRPAPTAATQAPRAPARSPQGTHPGRKVSTNAGRAAHEADEFNSSRPRAAEARATQPTDPSEVMIHRTFRSLDDPPKLLGFTMRQWVALMAGASVVLGLIFAAHLPTKPAITLCVFTLGLPAAVTYVSESGGLQLGVLLRDCWHWRMSIHTLAVPSPQSAPARGLVVLAPREERIADGALAIPDPSLEDHLSEERWG
ncbi:MAG: hypothetical protein ACYDA6_04810 [Solirubrobacteraceae bacterium]